MSIPMTHPTNPPSNDDREHLRLLAIFHYVLAGMVALFSCFPFIHLFLGLQMLTGGFGSSGPDPEARLAGVFFVGLATVFILAGWAFAAVLVVAGRSLAAHRRHLFCLVVAALACMAMPFGTVLGVFTLLVLLRPSVKELFGVAPPVPAPAA